MKVTKRSLLSQKLHTLEVPITEAQLARYLAGALIQDAAPELDIDLREFLITGITPEEWLEAFSEEDDELG